MRNAALRPFGSPRVQCSCPECGKTCGSRAALNTHHTTHHRSVGDFPCPECGACFLSASGLGHHRKRQHGVVGAWHYTASQRPQRLCGDLRDHRLSRYRCRECGVPWPTAHQLATHVRRVHRATATARPLGSATARLLEGAVA